MLDSTRAEARCARIEQMVRSGTSGEIQLLRSARTLRRVHADLVRKTRERIAAGGPQPALMEAQESLVAMEHCLKRVLLNYPFVTRREMHENVMYAVEEAIRVFALLDTSPLRVHA